MALRRFTAEGQPNGTSLTVANSTPGSGDQLTTVSKGGAGTAVFSTAQAMHGTRSILVSCPAAADTVILGYGGMATSSLPGEFYIYLLAAPTASTIIAQTRVTGAAIANLLLTVNRQITVTDAAGTSIQTFTTALALNTWYRVALRVVPGTTTTVPHNGQVYAAFYLGDSTTSVDAVYSNTAANTGSSGANSAVEFRWGKLQTAGTLSAHFDDASVNDGSGSFVGPANALAAFLSVDPTSGTVPFNVTAFASATGGTGTPYSYAFDWGDGGTTAAQASNQAVHQYTVASPVGQPYTVTATVTNT